MRFDVRFSNFLYYQWRRSNWVLLLQRLYSNYIECAIRDPIFLLGNQGGGLTLISRMLRRQDGVVSVTGGREYWAGADEMQNVMRCRLPRTLRLGGRFWCRDYPHERFSPPRSWSYAADDLIDAYRNTQADYTEESARKLRFLIQEALHRFGDGESDKRFVDKSQVFTVKMSYVNALLKDTNPYFVLITRNPYAACYRAAKGKAGDMKRYASFLSLDERMEVCVQHWSNAMRCALEDRDKVSNFKAMRFEDFLREPRASLMTLCEFLDLPFLEDMIPSEHHQLPLGSKYRDRWYPLRTDVNKPYLEEIPDKYIAMVEKRCQPIAEHFGYSSPR